MILQGSWVVVWTVRDMDLEARSDTFEGPRPFQPLKTRDQILPKWFPTGCQMAARWIQLGKMFQEVPDVVVFKWLHQNGQHRYPFWVSLVEAGWHWFC